MKIILIILDSVGVGALPDAEKYNDAGANTLGNIAGAIKNFNLPNMARLGLYNLLPSEGILPAGLQQPDEVIGCYGKMAEASSGKDTPIGHWEITGIITEKPLPTYPNGFPKDLIEKYEKAIGTKTLGNYPCSGTEIIKQLGEQHYKTGYPIVYTSADSVFQIAAHEDPKIFGLEQLHNICEIARKMLVEPHNVGRVIARPFTGDPGNFTRTANRRDYAIEPPGETLLDVIKESGGEVTGIGKIEDIFSGRGITKAIHTKSNRDGMEKTLSVVKNAGEQAARHTLIFTNLVDFDMLWGHRRDVKSYYNGLKEFDDFLPQLQNALPADDVLMVTADHGCDPCHTGHTDHTREYVPLLVYGKKIKKGVNLGVRGSFSDVGRTIADFFNLDGMKNGASFRKEII
ncbi:MAG: phosphopentomutase [Elusimicrobia bacterium]|nr:phosphopentomutase [Elusimicrobiota bacterium]